MAKRHRFIDPDITRKGKLLDRHLKYRVYDNGPPLFSVIEFNLSGLCNRKCIFCPRSNLKVFPNVNRHMSVDLYKKIMRDLKEAGFDGTILYSAFGEPLLHKNVDIFIRLSREYCPSARVEIITNGDLLTAKILSGLFEAGLTTICISMYDGPHQLEHFNKLKNESCLKDDQVVLRSRWLTPKEHFGITLSNRAGMIEMKDIGITVAKKPMIRPCFYPFYQTLIDYDGRVLLCTHDWGRRLIAGDAGKNSIAKIWNNGILRDVRISLVKKNRNFSPCNLCDVDGILMGETHFYEWAKYYRKQKLNATNIDINI